MTNHSHQQPQRKGALITLLHPDHLVSFSNPEPTSFFICSYSLAVLLPCSENSPSSCCWHWLLPRGRQGRILNSSALACPQLIRMFCPRVRQMGTLKISFTFLPCSHSVSDSAYLSCRGTKANGYVRMGDQHLQVIFALR